MKSTNTLLAIVAGLELAFGSMASARDIYYVNDHLATTLAIIDDVEGEIAQLEADAFGSPINHNGSGNFSNPARYTSKPYDEDLGAYVFPFRNYRSEEGRWMSADPSGFPDGINGIAYQATPNSSCDPLGLVVINSMLEAISYYGMGLGGTVEAGPSLIADIRASMGDALLSLSSTLNSKLGQVPQSSNSGTISGAGTRSVDAGGVLGGVVLDISYSSPWGSTIWEASESGGEDRLVYATDVLYNFSFSDTWNFNWNTSYSFIKNILKEVIPGTIATTYSMLGYGTVGTSFTIIGSFTETISGAATQHRE